MEHRRRAAAGVAIVVALFLAVQLSALALVQPFDTRYQPVENPQDPTNSVLYFLAILAATGVMLLAFRYDFDAAIRALIVLSGAWISLYVFRVLVPPVVTVSGVNVLAVGLAVALGLALYVYPEWYVVDAAGVVMGAGAAGLFGIGFGILPALVLLVVLAVYDAISVYGTEHMLSLASGVLEMKVPVVLVVPLTLSYSFLEGDPSAGVADGSGNDDADDDGDGDGDGPSGAEDDDASAPADGDGGHQGPLERDVLFVGLGDAVIPTVLVASAAFFLREPEIPTVLGVALPAVTALIGTVVGLLVLLRFVLKGRPHAGLPLLNGGTIAGYLVGALASGLTLVAALGIEPYV